MRKKGTIIGQALTSFPSLIFVFLIVVALFAASFLLGSERESAAFDYLPGDVDSGVLLEVFLKDRIGFDELGIGFFGDEGDISMRDLLGFVLTLQGDEQKKLVEYVQGRFDRIYSCKKENKLYFVYYSGNMKRVYIDYPLTYENFIFPFGESVSEGAEIGARCGYLNNKLPSGAGSVVKAIGANSGREERLCLHVQGRAVC